MTNLNAFLQLQDNIRNNYEKLSKRLKQVAKYVLDEQQSVVFDTVAVIANKAQVPPSTLIRFANYFGFSGFNEIKQIFRENLIEEKVNYTERVKLFRKLDSEDKQINLPGEVLNIFTKANVLALKNLSDTIYPEQIEQAVSLLDKANRIFIIGLKRSYSVACYLNYALQHVDCQSFIIDGQGGMFDEQLNQVKSGDCVIAISFSPYAKETVDIMNATAKEGISQIAITDSQVSPLVSFSDISFVIKEAQVSGFRSQCATMSLTQSIAVALAIKKEAQQ